MVKKNQKTNLLDTLIEIKKTQLTSRYIQDILKNIVEEITIYQKLSKAPRFKSIVDSPVLQKKLPLVWKAFQGDLTTGFFFLTAIDIVNFLLDDVLQISIDYKNNLSKNESLLANTLMNSEINIQYEELDNFNHNDVTQNKIEVISTLTQPIANNSELIKNNMRLLLVTKILEDKDFNRSSNQTDVPKLIIYQGLINRTILENAVIEKTDTANSDTKTEKLTFLLNSYSVQGNNDYAFGTVTYNEIIYELSQPTTTQFRLHDTVNDTDLTFEMSNGMKDTLTTVLKLDKKTLSSRFKTELLDFFERTAR